MKPQPNSKTPHAIHGAGIQMRENASEQYFDYELINLNQGWKTKWFYIENQLPQLPKVAMYASEHHTKWKEEPRMN